MSEEQEKQAPFEYSPVEKAKITTDSGPDQSKDVEGGIGKVDCGIPVVVTSDGPGLEKGDQDHGHGDAHAIEPPTTVSLVASAVVCFVIYFVFSLVFSSVIFESLPSNSDPTFGVPQGVGTLLLGIAIGSVVFAWKSGCKAIMAGPDLLPIIFVAEAGLLIRDHFIDKASQVDDYANNYDDGHRWLAESEIQLSEEDIAKIIPTTLVAMVIGNVITGLSFYGLGRMKSTASAIGLIPSSVIAGFLTCIGYKVIKLAFLITTTYNFKMKYIHNVANQYEHANDPWKPLTIAVIMGISLYTLKRMHIIPTERLILGFIAIPLIVFFIVVAATGSDLQELREDGWFLSQADKAPFEYANFWQPIHLTYGDGPNVAWEPIFKCTFIFIMGSVMTVLDNMLKLTSSENALAVDLDYNHEMQLAGEATILSALLVGSPAYGQTKFNLINFSIGRSTESSLPTLGLGAICFAVFLSGISGPIINYIPRFLLGGLCVFAGVGFIYENLWEGRKTMTTFSFGIVWTIFLLNFIWEFFILALLPKGLQPMLPGLLIAFFLGVILSVFEFMFAFMQTAKLPTIRGGNECCSSAVRTEKHENQLAVMAPWFQVFEVESFVFFGTANKLYQQLKDHLNSQKADKPKAERTKILIFDMVNVTGIDLTATTIFTKVHRLLKSEGVHLVWAMHHENEYYAKFAEWGLHSGTEQHDSLDHAIRYVEDALLLRAHNMSQKWLVNPSVKALFERNVLANVFSISVRPDEKTFSSARLMPWTDKVNLSAGAALCAEGDNNLYLLYSGEVLLQHRGNAAFTIFAGSFFNLDGLLGAVGSLPGPSSTIGAVATKDSVVLQVSVETFLTIQQRDGGLAQKLLITLLVQNEKFQPGRVRITPQIAREQCRAFGVAKPGSHAFMLLEGDDHQVQLTESQVQRFARVFGILKNDPNDDDIEIHNFTKHIAMEAAFLGSALSYEQFLKIVEESGIDKDGDGVLTQEEFLEFLRSLFLADLPSKEIPILKESYDTAVVEAGEGSVMDEERVKGLFGMLGFDTESSQMKSVLGVIDSDGDGDVSFEEFLTGVAMMKRYCLQIKDLNNAFEYHKSSVRNVRKSVVNKDLSAEDLEAAFKVNQDEAAEMVFLADMDDCPAQGERTIDITEFQQLVMAWT